MTDSALNAGITYTYRVKAINAGGSSPGLEASVLTPAPPPPPPPPLPPPPAVCSSGPCKTGQWSAVTPWPVVPIHSILLADGRVMTFDGQGDTRSQVGAYTVVDLWNPSTNTHTPADNTSTTLFCAGETQLADGRVFSAGGTAPVNRGVKDTNVFNLNSNLWAVGQPMQYARWYPSVVNAANGEVLVVAGTDENFNVVKQPEVWQADGSYRTLTNVNVSLDYYPRVHLAPDGRVFFAGAEFSTAFLNTSGTGVWTSSVSRGDGIWRDYGSTAMYDIGKIVYVGGGPSTSSVLTMDINGPVPVITPTASLSIGRRQSNATLLADGTVLATGGNSNNTYFVDNSGAAVLSSELWNPASGQWRTLSSMQTSRQYHSTALLLPDGRVLVGGEGFCSTCNTNRYNVEIFSPPYLFNASGGLAARPTITSASQNVGYGASISIQTPNAASISKVALVKLGAVTHSFNTGQRYVPLSFTASAGALTASVSSNPNITPAGYYMLFVIDSNGVPSVSSMVHVGN